MAFIAQRRMEVGDRVVHRGDEVPEAADWPNLRAYTQLEWIKEVPDAEVIKTPDQPIGPQPAGVPKPAKAQAPAPAPVKPAAVATPSAPAPAAAQAAAPAPAAPKAAAPAPAKQLGGTSSDGP